MSQVTGALTLELDLDRLAEKVAARVVELLVATGSDVYEPGELGPQGTGRPWPGVRHGDDAPEPGDG